MRTRLLQTSFATLALLGVLHTGADACAPFITAVGAEGRSERLRVDSGSLTIRPATRDLMVLRIGDGHLRRDAASARAHSLVWDGATPNVDRLVVRNGAAQPGLLGADTLARLNRVTAIGSANAGHNPPRTGQRNQIAIASGKSPSHAFACIRCVRPEPAITRPGRDATAGDLVGETVAGDAR